MGNWMGNWEVIALAQGVSLAGLWICLFYSLWIMVWYWE
jgi:hypothetical protein